MASRLSTRVTIRRTLGLILMAGVALPLAFGSETESKTTAPATQPHVQADSPIEAGRYLVTVGGCNDCHTAGYLETEGKISEVDWLTGSPIGWRGPWGTTYASNLRLMVQDLSEDAWVEMLRTRAARPPMPWANVNKLSEPDARAIYRFIQALGPKGERMPASAAPEGEPHTPYILLVPQHLERLQQLVKPEKATN